MKKVFIIFSIIFSVIVLLGILFIGVLFLGLSLQKKEDQTQVEEEPAEKYTLTVTTQDILYEYNDYVYVVTETTNLHNDEHYYVGLFAKSKKDYYPYSWEQEFALLKEFDFCEFFHMKNYNKGVFIDGRFYYVANEKNTIEVYTLNGYNIPKEVITLEEGNAGFLGDFGIESIDDNYIYLNRIIEYFTDKWDKVRCSKTTYVCELYNE